jgi:hypothetical protein
MLPGGIGQNEVIEPVIKGLARDAHAHNDPGEFRIGPALANSRIRF